VGMSARLSGSVALSPHMKESASTPIVTWLSLLLARVNSVGRLP
jgi:hypothetical protein